MRDLERKDGDRGDAERFCLADSGWRGAVKDYVSGAGWKGDLTLQILSLIKTFLDEVFRPDLGSWSLIPHPGFSSVAGRAPFSAY